MGYLQHSDVLPERIAPPAEKVDYSPLTRDHSSVMTELEHELRRPANDDEWRVFHAIRRKVLFEGRGKGETYIENHPDDAKPGNHPLVLMYKDSVIGVVRIDVVERVAWFRRVAIREDLQRLGHGRVLLTLAEAFAKGEGCDEVRCNAAVESADFYEHCGYVADVSAHTPANSVSMWKSLLTLSPASA